jgi:hypothetical protein
MEGTEVTHMSIVITQNDIMKFSGMDKAVFSEGTIVTPAARDWAGEHGVEIITGGNGGDSWKNAKPTDPGRSEVLKYTVKSVLSGMQKNSILVKEDAVEAVALCLQKLGCRVE